MGIFTDVKATTAGKHAVRARDEGRTVLVFRVNMPRNTTEGTPISGIAEQIEAVEAEGWRLDRLGDLDGKGVALFRRA
jgi:hypothetical protein